MVFMEHFKFNIKIYLVIYYDVIFPIRLGNDEFFLYT